MRGRFIDWASTVARPVAVKPKRSTPSQRKWSLHLSRLGLKRGAALPVSGSWAATRAALRREQETHASARLLAAVLPPARDHMIHVKFRFLSELREMAILATGRGSLENEPA